MTIEDRRDYGSDLVPAGVTNLLGARPGTAAMHGFGDRGEPVDVQALIPERSIEGLDIGIVRGFAGTREVDPYTMMIGPRIDQTASKFGAVVSKQIFWRFALPHRTGARPHRDPRGDARDCRHAPTLRLSAGRRDARTQGACHEPQEALTGCTGRKGCRSGGGAGASAPVAAVHRCRCRCVRMIAGRWTSWLTPSALPAGCASWRSTMTAAARTFAWRRPAPRACAGGAARISNRQTLVMTTGPTGGRS